MNEAIIVGALGVTWIMLAAFAGAAKRRIDQLEQRLNEVMVSIPARVRVAGARMEYERQAGVYLPVEPPLPTLKSLLEDGERVAFSPPSCTPRSV